MFWKLVSLGLFALLVHPAAAWAEEQSAVPLFLEVRTTEVNPGKNAAYERLVGMVRQAQREAEWDGLSFTHQVRVGKAGTYYTATQHNSFTELAPNNLIGDDDIEEFNALLAESIKSSTVQVFMIRNDLGREPPQTDTPPDYYTTLLVQVKRGSGPVYEEAVQRLVEANEKISSSNYWFGSSPGIAAGSTYRFVLPGRWATSDLPTKTNIEVVTEAFGEAEANRWVLQIGGAIDDVQTTMSINRPDLSYLPDAN